MTLVEHKCNLCQKLHPISNYSKKNPNQCRVCLNVRAKEWRERNSDYTKQYGKRYRENNLEGVRAGRRRAREVRKDYYLQASRDWRKNNPDKQAKNSASRRKGIKQASPLWANQKYISMFYQLAKEEEKRLGVKIHVDHIVPLKSKYVCGLHNEFNLQLLTREDNLKKFNRFSLG
jgi:hypothetical protein